MPLNAVSLNALRAFDAAARHLSFTRAAEELCVTQAAVSHQVKALEGQLGVALFRRTTRGLVLSDEGMALAPITADCFERLGDMLEALAQGGPREVLTISVVGTFAIGFLLERLADFRARHPRIDLRVLTNNNKVDVFGESLDCAIRFGDGAWRGIEALALLEAPIAPMCAPALAQNLRAPEDLARCVLLRSYRAQDWPAWFKAARVSGLAARGAMFDSSSLMVQAAQFGEGVALAPPSMFRRELLSGQLIQPFEIEAMVGGYWLTRPASKEVSPALACFSAWLSAACAVNGSTPRNLA